MSRKITKVCVDCGDRPKNRSKITKRCISCHKKNLSNNANGRKTGKCIICGNSLSTIKNTTSKCLECYAKNPQEAWNKGMKGSIPWNKGQSRFKNEQERIQHINKSKRINYHKKTKKDKIADSVRTLIRNSIQRKKPRRKLSKTKTLLGCDINFFIEYIEKLFTKNMHWNNYGNGHGKWNIDHKKPLSLFDLSLLKEQKLAFHFTNCQPMWAIDNIKKGNKY
jgi:hypothetical protein